MSLHERLDDHRSANRNQALLLVLALTAIVSLCGYTIGGLLGLALALFAVALAVLAATRTAAAVVLKMYKAQPITVQNGPELVQLFQALVQRTDLPTAPRLFYVPSNIMNAFAVGHGDDAAIAVTAGLLNKLNPRELAGVLAHELSHVVHKDLVVMSIADALSRITTVLGQAGQIMILLSLPALFAGYDFPWLGALLLMAAPGVSAMLQLALSRAREYSADVGAVAITGDGLGLASALQKIEQVQSNWFDRLVLPGRKEVQPAILRTHPHTHDRIERLKEMVGDIQASTLPRPEHMLAQSTVTPRPLPRWHALGLWY
ncbi:MAG: zinc metalloprotease HtpX [Pseudomonadales bacterium]